MAGQLRLSQAATGVGSASESGVEAEGSGDQPALSLRQYQRDCLNANWRLWRGGARRLLNALPTGTGKTVIFSQLPKAFPGRYLVIAHRKELLDQAAAKVGDSNPGLRVEVEQADRRAEDSADVVVASIQSLAVSPERLERIRPASFGTVVIDEAHHAMARTYCQLLAHLGLAPDVAGVKAQSRKAMDLFREFRPDVDAPLLLGFTATPHRTDKLGLEYLFDEMAYSRTIPEMMDEGWLCRISGYRLATVDLSGVRTSSTEYGQDYRESDLRAVVDTPERNAQAVAGYRQYCDGQQAIVFCVDVEHTANMMDAFDQAGLGAETAVVTGLTPKQERDAIIAAYKSGILKRLVNCMVLTEGFDAPETSCLLMCRPTQSQLLYTQMMGRGTRPAPDKERLTVLDMVDVTSTGICTVNTLFGLPPDYDLDGRDVKDTADEEEAAAMYRQKQARSSRMVVATGEIDPLQAQAVKIRGSKLSWVKTQYGYALGLPDRQYVGIIEDLLGHGEVRAQLQGQQAIALGKHVSVQDAAQAAEAWIAEGFPEHFGLKRADARWRYGPPSDKQVALCQRLKLPITEGMTRGQISDMLDAFFSANRRFA